MAKTKRIPRAEMRMEMLDKSKDYVRDAIDVVRELSEELDELSDALEEHFSSTERYDKVETARAEVDDMLRALENAEETEIDFSW